MYNANANGVLVARILLVAAVLAALPSPAWAYINGGTKRNSLGRYEQTLKAEGWSVSCGPVITLASARVKEVAKGVVVVPEGNLEYRKWMSTFAPRAYQKFSTEDRERISLHAGSEVTLLAQKAICTAVFHEREAIEHGRFGAVECQVGAYEAHTWWETRYRGKLEIHAKKLEGLVPFVALRMIDPFDPAAANHATKPGTPDGPKFAFTTSAKNAISGAVAVPYAPLDTESEFLKKVNEPAVEFSIPADEDQPLPAVGRRVGDWKNDRLAASEEKYVGWFGIVRGRATKEGIETIDLEHKFFDGNCDGRIQTVSMYGAGDFSISISSPPEPIPRLSLLRVYGVVGKDHNGVTLVKPEFIRVWRQPQFAFLDYGEDYSNPKWKSLRKTRKDKVFTPSPNHEYYYSLLGPRE